MKNDPAMTAQSINGPDFFFTVHFHDYPLLSPMFANNIASEFYGTHAPEDKHPMEMPTPVRTYAFPDAKAKEGFIDALAPYAKP